MKRRGFFVFHPQLVLKEGGRLALLYSNTESMWATRPPLQQHSINVGDSPSFTATHSNVGESPSFVATQQQCGRVAHTPLQQHSINVGESPSFAATQQQCGRVAHTPL
jgi:hypothetical protein